MGKCGKTSRSVVAVVVAAAHVGALAAPGGIVRNGTSSGVTVPGFLFEPEVPFASLKHVPTWSELEQMLDHPYAFTPDPATPGNDQGFPSYRTAITRRPGFGVLLPQFLMHPLNYNTTTGEEMRIISRQFRGGPFDVIDRLAEGPPGTFTWTTRPETISRGVLRVEQGSTPIDYNNPIAPDRFICVTVTETVPPEGSILCGADPGEPGYAGFGVLLPPGGDRRRTQYSTPAIPLPPGATAGTVVPATARLFDPGGCGGRNDRSSGSCTSVAGGGGEINRLLKPTLRRTPTSNPNYLQNRDPDDVRHSNENDFVRNQGIARVLGKAMFWDMQVGSDNTQSCGTCHFNGTGTDTRTKNQLNPNHLGGDGTLQVGDTLLDPSDAEKGMAANYTLKPSDFPLHRITNPDVAGDPACTTPLVANVDAAYATQATAFAALIAQNPNATYHNPITGDVVVCDAKNVEKDVNDVVSSMGVHWGIFKDIAPIGSWVVDPVSLVRSVAPDLRETAADCSGAADVARCLRDISDPIAAFAGSGGTGEAGVLNQFRRVEPRNTPTMQAAAFNFDNFWDGRARHDFNGGSVFGASDPQTHVFVSSDDRLVATRQIIRFASIASLATGPGLSEFEMSYLGRNWAKIGKKLLQAGATPLANQLVDPTDSLLGPYSNQGGSACGNTTLVPVADRSGSWIAGGRAGRPGLCISYGGLIKQAFFPALWNNDEQHLNGCYTDGRTEIHPNQCATAGVPVAIRVLAPATDSVPAHVVDSPADPFDGYVLTSARGRANRSNTNQFTQMEGNFSLFWGLAVNSWVQVLVPDDTPFDGFLDRNPGAFRSLGEPGEPGLVADLLNCGQAGADPNFCFTPFGNFKRDPSVKALQDPTGENAAGGTFVNVSGTRNPAADPDPLLGLDLFFASNLSLKNPNFRTGRCGECHAIPTLTDHTMPFTSKINLMDAVAEFSQPGVELIVEPLARLRVISGFLLESEINENGQDAVERRFVNQSIVPNPTDGLAYPGASREGLPGFGPWTGADAAFLDNGIYNLGIRPIGEDIGRGNTDAFGWPLSIAVLMMKNLGGEDYDPGGTEPGALGRYPQPPAPGIPIGTFDPEAEGFNLFEATAQDPLINPGLEGEPANPLLPAYLAAFTNNITVGDFPPEMDEAGGAIGGMVNTLTDIAMIEGFMDTLGPFNPANVAAEVLNQGGFSDRFGDTTAQMGTWPNVNRVGRMGSFKASPLRNVELTGPYFHNGGKLTLRQVVDFYTRGGDFPITNAAHRDFNLVNMNVEIQSNLSEAEKVALVDFLLELTDERNRFARAPFDHPEVIVPLDGAAPENRLGRDGLLKASCGAGNPCFQQIAAVGAGGLSQPERPFLNVTNRRLVGDDAKRGATYCDFDGTGTREVSQYCH